MSTSPIPRLAHDALDRARPGLLGQRGGAIREAEESLARLRDQATLSGDRGAAWVAEVTLAASRAAEPHPKSRLELLRHAFRTLEAATAASAGYLAGIASRLRDPLDEQECPKPLRDEVVRAVLHETARVAARDGVPEAGYLGLLAEISELIPEPGYALNMATRSGMAELGDLSRPAWLASVGSNLADAERTGPTLQARQILDLTSERVREVAAARGDASVPAWFARAETWKALPLSDRTKFFLDRAVLDLLDLPAAPESGLVLAWRMRRYAQTPQERETLLDQALQEARSADYPPGDRTARWLDFMDRAEGRLREGALTAIAEGKPAAFDSMAFDAHWHLKEQPAGAGALMESLFVLEPPTTAREAAALGLKAADLSQDPLVQEVLLRRTFARGLELDPTVPQAKLPVGTLDLVRFAVRSMADGGDGIDRILAGTAAPVAGEVTEEPDWVQIGSIRVPRRTSA